MQYHICEANSAGALQAEVTRLISKGWRPSGGVAAACSTSSGIWWYYQAMVHLSEDADADYDQDEAYLASDPELA